MKNWFKLDNAAQIYPPTQTRNWAFMFRLSVSLTEQIDPDILNEAHKNILKRMPSFACRLRKGLFWYYLERIDGVPPIYEDRYNPMSKINLKENRYFQYRLLYYKNRIAVEFFHVLTDGAGGLTFLISLTAEYLRLAKGMNIEVSIDSDTPIEYILSCADKHTKEEYEDSFIKYASKEIVGRKETKSYKLKGRTAAFNKLLLISGKASTSKIKEKAKEYNVSIGVFLAAVLLQAVYKKQQTEKKESKRKLDVKIAVPINLRRIFPSKTIRNFSFFLNVGIASRLGEYSFDDILNQVNHAMGMHINDKELSAKFSKNVALVRNPFVRITPLFIKSIITRIIYSKEAYCYNASTISNLGMVTLPDEMSSYVDRIDFIMGRIPEHRSNVACISFKDQTIFNFSRSMVEADVERYFFTTLVEMGIPVSIESNGR